MALFTARVSRFPGRMHDRLPFSPPINREGASKRAHAAEISTARGSPAEGIKRHAEIAPARSRSIGKIRTIVRRGARNIVTEREPRKRNTRNNNSNKESRWSSE